MFGSTVLDIGIGLVLTYLFLSLVVTAANELLATFTRARAIDLERGVRNLLDGQSCIPERWWDIVWRRIAGRKTKDLTRSSEKPVSGGWSESFFQHQLINALAQDQAYPCYIPSQTFATVLTHLVQRSANQIEKAIADAEQAAAAAALPVPPPVAAPAVLPNPPRAAPAVAAAIQNARLSAISAFHQAFTNNQQVADGPPMPGLATFDEIRATIEMINNPEVKRALLPLVEAARTDLTNGISAMQKFTNQIEVWFDHSMDRVSGWYIRRTKWFLFAIALVFTGLLNVDTVAICRRLGNDTILRTSLVDAAKQYTAQAAKEPDKKSGPDQTEAQALAANLKNVQDEVGRLTGLGIPLGWTYEDNKNSAGPRDDNLQDLFRRVDGRFVNRWLLVTKIMGLLLTAFAASLGAPFWFDVLNKFMSVRGAGKAPDEKSRQPKQVLQPQGPQSARSM
jgi:hypothetical protein